MITGPSPWTNANRSITAHSPSLAGTLDFTITGVVSDMDFYYATGPDASPEPFSMSIAGGTLIAIGLFGRRLFAAN